MSYARYKSALNGLTGVATKVFEAIPIGEAWTAQQIAGEMRRKSGTQTEFATVQGCLNSLQEAGLVRGHAGLWQRTKEPKKPDPSEKDPVVQLPTTVVDLKTFDKDPQPSDMVRRLANQLADLAAELERVAADMDKLIGQYDEKLAKFKQLKELLGSM